MNIRKYLREATVEQHRRLDALAGGMRLDLASGYGAFLIAQADAMLPVERALNDAGIARLLPDWPQRCRADALLQDLRELRLVPQPVRAPAFGCDAALWGAAYVLEGSRLGARFLLARAKGPTRFLRHGDGMRLWPSFLSQLEAADVDRERAAAAAKSVFRLFEQSFDRQLPIAA